MLTLQASICYYGYAQWQNRERRKETARFSISGSQHWNNSKEFPSQHRKSAYVPIYCQMAGLELASTDVIREEGVSASVPLFKRPGGARLLERVSNGIGNVVALMANI